MATYTGNYISDEDVDNWQSGTTDAEKQSVVEIAEAILDEALGAPRYIKSFDIKINGNGKNRLFVPLNSRIKTVTEVWVGGELLDEIYYDHDGASIFIDLSSSGVGGNLGPERLYLLTEADEAGIFPRGYNNIRIKGTCGETAPAWAKKAAVILARSQNDGSLYATYKPGSETIGRYSYSIAAGGTKDKRYFITGIEEVDNLIRPFCGKKKVTIMAP
jgi:hypothetical protein